MKSEAEVIIESLHGCGAANLQYDMHSALEMQIDAAPSQEPHKKWIEREGLRLQMAAGISWRFGAVK